MKKISTFLLLLAFIAAGSMGVMNAQEYYKKFHVNEDFEGVETWPAGWSWVSNNTCIIGKASNTPSFGPLGAPQGFVTVSASGSGARGGEVRFPTTLNSPDNDGERHWFVEFDWTVNSANWRSNQANGILIAGSQSVNLNTDEDWYVDGVLGLYVYKNGEGAYIHYWNMDLEGYDLKDADGNITGKSGPAFLVRKGNNSFFNRGGDDYTIADENNLSTKTDVTFAEGTPYHIIAELDFKNQKVVSLTITDKTNPENTTTITDKDFLAKSLVGTTATVAEEDRIVKEIDRMAAFHTRTSGGSGALNHSYDNYQVYVLEQSLGRRDVTINYVDRDGAAIKDARVVEQQEVGNPYKLISSDKISFFDEAHTYFYAYDAEATHVANADKGEDGESVVVSLDGDNSLTVVYKKTAVAVGEYVWTGETGFNWDELENNFSVGGAPSIGYQNGNAVAFSDENVLNKEVQLSQLVELGEGDLTISAPGYSITGTGRVAGTGTLIVDKGVTLGVDNTMEGGALINTTEPIHIKHPNAATQYKVIDNGLLKLEAGADFTKAIEAAGTLNLEALSNNIYSPAITNASTINILMNVEGRHNANWSSAWRAVIPENAQVNVATSIELDSLARPVGFGVRGDDFKMAKLHLGDSIRFVRDYNEANNTFSSTTTVGELSGTEKSVIEGGFIDGRASTLEVGHLNTDAVFAGEIRQYKHHTSGNLYDLQSSLLRIRKVGTGKWTLNGPLNYKGELLIAKDGGTIELGANVAPTVTTINVDTAGVLVAKNVTIESPITVNIGTIGGSFTANSVSLTGSTIKMNVNSFNEGDHDQMTTIANFTALEGENHKNCLDITVNAAEEDAIIDLIKVGGEASLLFDQVLVNGVNIITGNTYEEDPYTGAVIIIPTPNPNADFVFAWDNERKTATLKSKIKTSVKNVFDNKTIQSIQLYDITGRAVKSNTKGLVIKQTTYTDGTRSVEKVYIREER